MILFHGIFLPWVRRAGAWLFWPAVAVVVWGELTPHPPSAAALLWDKAEHFIAYFGLTLLASLAWGLRRSLAWVFAGMVALGGALEIIQSFVGRDAPPPRSPRATPPIRRLPEPVSLNSTISPGGGIVFLNDFHGQSLLCNV